MCYAYVCEELFQLMSPALAGELRKLCLELEETYVEVADGVDLHRLSSPVLVALDAGPTAAALEGLCRRAAVLLESYREGRV